MKKRILAYRRRIDKLIEENSGSAEWSKIMKEHLQQIAFFQHERLIHLIVTMTFAVMTLISIGIAVVYEGTSFYLLTTALLILLIPYIYHYFILENEVQKMYDQYDKILLHINQ
ncbi:MAG: hypothetical protein NC320_04435 [Clostridium sp.]|nr:hypothetical protein [Clostridium sp.]